MVETFSFSPQAFQGYRALWGSFFRSSCWDQCEKRYACSPLFSHVPRKKESTNCGELCRRVFHGFSTCLPRFNYMLYHQPNVLGCWCATNPNLWLAQTPQNSVPKSIETLEREKSTERNLNSSESTFEHIWTNYIIWTWAYIWAHLI